MINVDTLWFFASIALSVVGCVREYQISNIVRISNQKVDLRLYMNVGAFASAATFEFLCSILYLAHGIIQIKKN